MLYTYLKLPVIGWHVKVWRFIQSFETLVAALWLESNQSIVSALKMSMAIYVEEAASSDIGLKIEF